MLRNGKPKHALRVASFPRPTVHHHRPDHNKDEEDEDEDGSGDDPPGVNVEGRGRGEGEQQPQGRHPKPAPLLCKQNSKLANVFIFVLKYPTSLEKYL